jgi:hypothetical protein
MARGQHPRAIACREAAEALKLLREEDWQKEDRAFCEARDRPIEALLGTWVQNFWRRAWSTIGRYSR